MGVTVCNGGVGGCIANGRFSFGLRGCFVFSLYGSLPPLVLKTAAIGTETVPAAIGTETFGLESPLGVGVVGVFGESSYVSSGSKSTAPKFPCCVETFCHCALSLSTWLVGSAKAKPGLLWILVGVS